MEQILFPTVQNGKRFDFSDAEIIEPVSEVQVNAVKRTKHFIEANTVEVTLDQLKNDCITPVFAKDNELQYRRAMSSPIPRDSQHYPIAEMASMTFRCACRSIRDGLTLEL